MLTHRTLAVGVGVAIAAASLTVGGTAASYASPSSPNQARTATSASAVPLANAPHVSTRVAGAAYGTHLPIDNAQSVKAFRELHEQMLGQVSGTAKAQPQTIHEYLGTSFDVSTVGAQATQSVSRKIKPADPGTTLYTPTMYPSGNSCIEVSTAYFHTSQVVAAWDWCQAIRFVVQVNINKSFMKTYTNHQNYSEQIVQTNKAKNTWTAYLYNYKTDAWETFYSQSGQGQTGLSQGWDLYELYSNIQGDGQSYACTDLEGRRIQAKHIKVGVNGTLVNADPTNAGHAYDVPLSQFQCPSLTYTMVTPYSHWKAIG